MYEHCVLIRVHRSQAKRHSDHIYCWMRAGRHRRTEGNVREPGTPFDDQQKFKAKLNASPLVAGVVMLVVATALLLSNIPAKKAAAVAHTRAVVGATPAAALGAALMLESRHSPNPADKGVELPTHLPLAAVVLPPLALLPDPRPAAGALFPRPTFDNRTCPSTTVS
jgi:hypothetical protein